MRKGFLLVGLLALGGCLEDAAPKPAARADDGAASRVRTAAEERVRGVARDANSLRFRAVETYRQAMADTYAVCGQATVTGEAVYIPFVSVVSQRNGAMEVEQFVGRSNVEATRVYVEMVGRCFEGGGPIQRAGGTLVSAPTPPLPNGLPLLEQVRPEAPPTPDLITAAASAAPASAGTVVMKQNGNLRASPGGGGAVLRVARTGTVMNVFGTAPGGWFQVGETEPLGWVHSTVAVRQAPGMSSGALASVQ